MEPTAALIVAVIVAALLLDVCTGWNNAASSIATAISTRALSPRRAIALAAVFTVAGAFWSEEVAKTICGGLVHRERVTPTIVLAAVLAAVWWVGVMTRLGVPVSGSHALIGGLVGAAGFGRGGAVVQVDGVTAVLVAMLALPVLAGGSAFGAMLVVLHLFRRVRPTIVNELFGKLQLVSVSLASWMRGANDAQKVMGVIVLALVAGGSQQTIDVPLWLKLACGLGMAFGTAAGAWRAVRTTGMQRLDVRPAHGVVAEMSASLALGIAATQGIPVSTTHAITAAVLGVGATKRPSVTAGSLGRKVLLAWALTLPVAALLAGGLYHFLVLVGVDP